MEYKSKHNICSQSSDASQELHLVETLENSCHREPYNLAVESHDRIKETCDELLLVDLNRDVQGLDIVDPSESSVASLQSCNHQEQSTFAKDLGDGWVQKSSDYPNGANNQEVENFVKESQEHIVERQEISYNVSLESCNYQESSDVVEDLCNGQIQKGSAQSDESRKQTLVNVDRLLLVDPVEGNLGKEVRVLSEASSSDESFPVSV